MSELRRISLLAVLLLVVLRIAIGWHLLYEGLWKYNTMSTAHPWTSEGYLKNAQGPLRDHFRNMTGDPDDLGWLDYDTVSNRWNEWRDRFAAHYGLDDAQRASLNRMLEGADAYTATLSALPGTAQIDSMSSVLTYDPQKKLLIVQGETPLLPSEIARLKGMVPVVRVDSLEAVTRYLKPGTAGSPEDADPLDVEFYKAIERLEALQARELGYRRKLAASLKGDPERVGVIGRLTERGSYAPEMGTVTEDEEDDADRNIRYGEIQVYKDMLAKHSRDLKEARTDFQHEHLEKVWGRIQQKRIELTGPVKGLDNALKEDAGQLLTAAQLQKGPPPPLRTPQWAADQQAMWGLLILGTLLILGLCTRLAALGGAVMLMMFYLAVPPWPGVPQPPGPDHAFIVNKNFIEALALLAIAALPTGSWFGLDGVFSWLFFGRKQKR